MFFITAYFFLSCICTLLASIYIGNPVFASAFVTTAYCFSVLPVRSMQVRATPVYIGSFAGMITPRLIDTGWLSSMPYGATLEGFVVMFAACVSFFFLLFTIIDSKPYLRVGAGYGGRMGSIAFVTCILFYLVFREGTFPMGFSRFSFTDDVMFILKLGVFSVVGCGMTLIFRKLFELRFEEMNIVFSSALAGLIIATPTLWFIDAYPIAFAAAAYSGSFIGMTATNVIEDYRILLGLSLVNGIVLWLMSIIFAGLGGLLGLCAFICVSIFVITRYFMPHIKALKR